MGAWKELELLGIEEVQIDTSENYRLLFESEGMTITSPFYLSNGYLVIKKKIIVVSEITVANCPYGPEPWMSLRSHETNNTNVVSITVPHAVSCWTPASFQAS